MEEAIAKFERAGARVRAISLPHTESALAAYYIIQPAEAAANLARYDGIRYGQRSPAVRDLLSVYTRTRGDFLGAETRRRIMVGTYTLSAGYYDAYYLKAQKVRALVKDDFTKAFEDVDVIITPTAPTPAFKLGEKAADPLAMYAADIFTVTANLAGVCGLSIPCGAVDNLPVGLQLLGPWFGERLLFKTAELYEKIK